MAEAAVLGPFVTGQNIATSANFMVPTRGATTVTSKKDVKEEIKDIPGEWTPSNQLPVTGHTTLTFYKQRTVHATSNIPMAAFRAVKEGGRAVEKFALMASGKIAKLVGKESKGEDLKGKAEEVKVVKYKCRCAVPIDIAFTVVRYEGYLPDQAKKEKERAQQQVRYEEQLRKYHEDLAKYKEAESGKGKAKLEEGQEPQLPRTAPPAPARPKIKIWLFSNVSVNVGAAVKNSLGEQMTLEVSCYPEWNQNDGSRWLRISWRAFNGGMKATKGFEHSGVAIALLKSDTKLGLLGEYDDAHLEPGEQSEETQHYFPGFQPEPSLTSSKPDLTSQKSKNKEPISKDVPEESEEGPSLVRKPKPPVPPRPLRLVPPKRSDQPQSLSVMEREESDREKST